MRSFTDPNTTTEQNRLKDATLILKVELLRQYANAITSVNSGAKQIVVPGDATGLIATQDYICIPLHEFRESYEVTGISYASGSDETTITIDIPSLPSSVAGKYVAKRYIVSYGNTERMIEMSTIASQLEGEALNEFMTSDVSFTFDNFDGFFSNLSGSGILDNRDIYWARVWTGYKNASDRVLYFGGLIDLEEVEFGPTVTLTAYGHAKELERYPGYLISQPFGRLLRLRGVTLYAAVASSRTRDGVKELEYEFETRDIAGVRIRSIDKGTPLGVRSLKFRFPNFLKYHDGDWTEVAEDSELATLTDAAGSTLRVDTSTYDIRDDEIFLYIESAGRPEIRAHGRGRLTFNKGNPVVVEGAFNAIYSYSGSAYSDVSNVVIEQNTVLTFAGSAYELLFFTDRPFYGLDLQLSSTSLLGTIDIEYSNGLGSWQTVSSFADGTANLTQSGKITWSKDAVAGWRSTSVEYAGVPELYSKYALRISLSSYTSGSVTIEDVKRLFRLFSDDDTILDLELDQRQLPRESVNESIVIRDIDGTLTPCTWYANLEDRNLLGKVLSEAQFGAAEQDIDELQINEITPQINIWGELPVPFYKKATAIYFDTVNEILWIGAENELWYTYEGEFYRVHTFPIASLTIRRLVKDISGSIQGVAWPSDYDQFLPYRDDNANDNDSVVWFFRANLSGMQDVNTSSLEYINPMERVFRKGKFDGTAQWVLGAEYAAGENLIIPFPQALMRYRNAFGPDYKAQDVLYNTAGILSTTTTGNGLFYFGTHWNSQVNKGIIYFPAIGHYQIKDGLPSGDNNGWIQMRYRLGNAGFVEWDPTEEKWVVYRNHRSNLAQTDTNVGIGYKTYNAAFSNISSRSDSGRQILCGKVVGTQCLMAEIYWDDTTAAYAKMQLLNMTLSGGLTSTDFDTAVDSAEAGSSIAGREDRILFLEFASKSNYESHGCLLDRENFEYHYFVLSNDKKLYTTQIGSNFTFDKHRQIKNFVVLGDDVFAVVVDTRYNEESCFLLKGEFSAGTITLTKIDTIVEGETDHCQLISDGTQLFGITGSGIVWQYANTFYLRTENVDLANMNLREVITELAKKHNMVWTIRADRKFLMYERESYDGELTLYEYAHIVSAAAPRRWEHTYEGIDVAYKNALREREGREEFGDFGWNRRVLSISSQFIQNRHVARLLAGKAGAYFTTDRRQIEMELIALIQAEEMDRIRIIMNSINRIDRNAYWLGHAFELDPENLIVKMKGVS